MADNDMIYSRSPEPLTLTILRARDLRGQRGDVVNAFVKVEFGDKLLGDSPKVECTGEVAAEFNYHAQMNIPFDDPLTLDEISCKPILCTLIEVLPKERKQKGDEKTIILGQCTVDLMPLLAGETKVKYTLGVNAVQGSPMEMLPPEHNRPELDVQLSVNEPLLSEGQLNDCNLMSITMESVYSPPESFVTTGTQYMYTATLPMPYSADKENCIVFAGGQLKPGVDKEAPNKQKKWAIPGNAQGNAIYIPDSNVASDAHEDEDGDYRAKEDREHRAVAEQDKNRVSWNIERRTYLDHSATKSFQDKIAKTRYWPVEVVRTAQPSAAKGKKEDEGHISFHGVVYLNLAPLLYPGVKRIRGAYKVWPFTEQELAEKTLRKVSQADEAVRLANGILSRSTSSPFPKPGKGGKEDTKAKDAKKGLAKQKTDAKAEPPSGAQPSTMKASDSASDADAPMVNAEGQQYVEAKSYAMIEICLNRPLVPKRQPEELAKCVAEYIPPRPLFPKRTDGAHRAVEDFHSQVGVVANLILDEFRDQFGDGLVSGEMSQSPEAMEERQHTLIYQLNSTGKYFAFKEQLKHAVVKIVREKYLKTTSFQDKDELQAFLSELYVYLLDQMHIGLSKVLALEDQSPIPEPLTDSAQLKHFAREAEVNENFDLAARYYQERIARDKNDPDHWLDYGTFCLYINDLTKAEECFKECVSIDQRHLDGLILYGVVCTMQDKHEAAETFFEAATCFEPKSILAWTMLGLFYDGISNEIGTEMALIEANKLNVQAVVDTARELKEQEMMERRKEEDRERERREEEMREREEKMVKEEGGGGEGEEPSDVATRDAPPSQEAVKQTPASPGSDKKDALKVKERRNSAVRKSDDKNKAKVKSTENVSHASSAHTRSPATLVPEPGESQEDVAPPREPTPVPAQTIFMQVVDFLLEVKAMPFAERALAHHLLDVMGGPSAEYHVSLARLKLQKHSLDEGEDSLKEALQFDHQHPDAWAIMGHVKYLTGDTEMAKQCYERTLDFVADASEMHSIYLRLASIYLQEGHFAEAKSTFLMACKRSPSCVSWLGVGIACYRLGELSEAEDALSEANILNNNDVEVWAYLSLVCLKTQRQVEAEQAYKYAIKLKLQDEDLISEIHRVQEEVGFGNPQL